MYFTDRKAKKLSKKDPKNDSNDPPLFCGKCLRKYKTRTTLLRHMTVECGKSPSHSCHICSYVAYHKHHLHSHLINKHQLTIFN